MTLRFDIDAPALRLCVGDLVGEHLPASIRPSAARMAARMARGRRVHQRHASQRVARLIGYRREVPLSRTIEHRGWAVTIHGRADGILDAEDATIVEEIKSLSITPERLAEFGHRFGKRRLEAYARQASLYCFLLQPNTTGALRARVVLIRARGTEKRVVETPYDAAATERFARGRLDEILAEHHVAQARIAGKARVAETLRFPFPAPRAGQEEMMEQVRGALDAAECLLVNAPAGAGKTVAALLPALRHALGKGARVVFVTAKNTQQNLCASTARMLLSAGAGAGALVMRAKERMCANEVMACHEELCDFAHEHFITVRDERLLERLAEKQAVLDGDHVFDFAAAAGVCPFELSLGIAAKADLLICDYNYVFDPRVALRDVLQGGRARGDVLIIDEAHNLADRARGYYSPELNRARVRGVRRQLAGSRGAFADVRSALDALLTFIDEASAPAEDAPRGRLVQRFDSERLERLAGIFESAAEDFSPGGQRITGEKDEVQELLHDVLRFLDVARKEGEEFAHIAENTRERRGLRVLCMDPSNMLRARMRGFSSVIAMSATLEPLEYSRDVLGLPEKRTRFRRASCPFPPERRLVLVDPTVNTFYRTRVRTVDLVARRIADVAREFPGNTLVFFSSFKYLGEVLSELRVPEAEIIVQERNMDAAARDRVLDALRAGGRPRVVMGVQGGIFAEGVDYPGDMCSAVVVVGPGLPRFSFEHRLVQEYYQRTRGKGFAYASLYPAMAKVAQAAGRLIRGPEDRGVILLLGERFAQAQFRSLFPREWGAGSPQGLVSEHPEADMARFRERGTSSPVGDESQG